MPTEVGFFLEIKKAPAERGVTIKNVKRIKFYAVIF